MLPLFKINTFTDSGKDTAACFVSGFSFSASWISFTRVILPSLMHSVQDAPERTSCGLLDAISYSRF